MTAELKDQVHDFWNAAACGEALYLGSTTRDGWQRQAQRRYELEPYIADLAQFGDVRGKRVLEIGVGLGADHQRFAEAGAKLSGIDLTERAVDRTQLRLSEFGLTSQLTVGDAEQLDFPDDQFDIVYSWGVLHHSPDTAKAVREVHRVLTPGGTARVMIYHKWSLVGLMLWARYAAMRLRPWTSLDSIYAQHLESPGTKAYTIDGARSLFRDFSEVRITTQLSHGDLLTSAAGQRHQGALLSMARAIWPRRLLETWFPSLGLFMLIDAKK